MLVSRRMQPLAGMLVVDLTRYLPGAFASRELLRLGARVVRIEQPDGDPMRGRVPCLERSAERRQGVSRDRPEGRPSFRPGPARARRCDPRRLPARRGRAARGRPERRSGDRRLLLDHGIRDGRPARCACGSRRELSRLGGRARRHCAEPAADPAGRSRCRARSARSPRFSLHFSSAHAPAAAPG